MMRNNHSLAIKANQVIIFGGCYLKKAFNDVAVFDTCMFYFLWWILHHLFLFSFVNEEKESLLDDVKI